MIEKTFIETSEAMFPQPNKRLLQEKGFAEVLCLERKRTDRSHRPFLLLLLELSPLVRGRRRPRQILAKNVIQSLKVSIRQTDMMGWYKNNKVIGAIFTELRSENPPVGTILERVNAALQAYLTPEQIAAIAVSVHLYPHRHLGVPEASANDKLYPDLQRQKSARLLKERSISSQVLVCSFFSHQFLPWSEWQSNSPRRDPSSLSRQGLAGLAGPLRS